MSQMTFCAVIPFALFMWVSDGLTNETDGARNLTILSSSSSWVALGWNENKILKMDIIRKLQHTQMASGGHLLMPMASDTEFQLWYWPENATSDVRMVTTQTNNFTLRHLTPGTLYNIWLLGISGNSTTDYTTLRHLTGEVYFCFRLLVYILPNNTLH